MTPPDARTAPVNEPATEAGRRLWDYAHGFTRLDNTGTRDKARDLIREEVLRIEAEERRRTVAVLRERLIGSGAYHPNGWLASILDEVERSDDMAEANREMEADLWNSDR